MRTSSIIEKVARSVRDAHAMSCQLDIPAQPSSLHEAIAKAALSSVREDFITIPKNKPESIVKGFGDQYPEMIDLLLLEARKKAAAAMLDYPAGKALLGPTAKLAEETGELIKACHKAAEGRGDIRDCYPEAVDVIAMVIRLVVEGDPNIQLPSIWVQR
nr:hypothetical protein [uncultured Cohaesibacter sp.]